MADSRRRRWGWESPFSLPKHFSGEGRHLQGHRPELNFGRAFEQQRACPRGGRGQMAVWGFQSPLGWPLHGPGTSLGSQLPFCACPPSQAPQESPNVDCFIKFSPHPRSADSVTFLLYS